MRHNDMLEIFKLDLLINKINWKSKQIYSKTRAFIGGGQYVYKLDENTKFLSLTEDEFSHVIYVCNGHEKIEMDWCCSWINAESINQSIIDCGANIGYFSAFISQRCLPVQILAVEGNMRTASLCKHNLNILKIQNVLVVHRILSENSSEHYNIPDNLGREPWQQAVKVSSESCTSYTTTLDNLVSEFKLTPSLVKIDCEGFEPLILKGANNLLNKIRPAFMIECNDNALHSAATNRYELFSLLRSYNYKLFHLASFTGYQAFGIEVDENFTSTEFNFAAIPNDESNLKRWNKSIQLL